MARSHGAEQKTSAAIAALVTRATTDPAFRAVLVMNPGVAAAQCGVEPSDVAHVGFVEKPTGVDRLVVLPDNLPAAQELDMEELEAVAGGACCDSAGQVCICQGTQGSQAQTQ